jgi:hypothetical protein
MAKLTLDGAYHALLKSGEPFTAPARHHSIIARVSRWMRLKTSCRHVGAEVTVRITGKDESTPVAARYGRRLERP